MDRNSFFLDVIIAESGIIQIELLKQKSAGSATTHFNSKIQQNFHRFVQLKMQFLLSRN